VLGGIAGGALGSLSADIAHGGLTFGGGLVAGALLGGLGLGGLAWGYEQLGGSDDPQVVWSTPFVERQLRDGALRYLGVSHFGRGAGAFRQRVEPEFWAPTVEREFARHKRALDAVWRAGRASLPAQSCSDDLVAEVDDILRSLLIELYPGVERFLR
jgi:hypothetical protein